MKRKKETKSKARFKASNGMTIEYAPDATAGKPLSAVELKRVKPLTPKQAGITAEVLQAVGELRATTGRGRPRAKHPKQPISFRFSAELVEHLKNDVEGYNVRVEHLLHQAMLEGRL